MAIQVNISGRWVKNGEIMKTATGTDMQKGTIGYEFVNKSSGEIVQCEYEVTAFKQNAVELSALEDGAEITANCWLDSKRSKSNDISKKWFLSLTLNKYGISHNESASF
jgi:hypothetical protein